MGHKTIQYWEKMGKLNLLNGILGAENLRRESDAHFKNREAEEAHVRKTVWGKEDSPEVEDMSNTVLGDVTYVVPQQATAPSVLPKLAMGALAATALVSTLAAGGLGGYLFSTLLKPSAVDPPSFSDGTVNLGLGRIEDYLQPKQK